MIQRDDGQRRETFYCGGTKSQNIVRKQSCLVQFIVQELCESRGGRPGLSVLTSRLVSMDVKIY